MFDETKQRPFMLSLCELLREPHNAILARDNTCHRRADRVCVQRPTYPPSMCLQIATWSAPTSTMPWVCYRRRNQWLRLALALFCLPLIWLTCCVPYVEAAVFGVGMNVGCDDSIHGTGCSHACGRQHPHASHHNRNCFRFKTVNN